MNPKYKQLYNSVQGLHQPKVKREFIRDETLALTGHSSVHPIMTGDLDTDLCRGYFISAANKESRFVQQVGGNNVIVIARDQSKCWQRFVFIKELMHLFDEDGELTGTEASFETVLTELSVTNPTPSKQTQAESRCFWMALALVCPEKFRLEFDKKRKLKHVDDYGIAVQLKIPEEHVFHLLRPDYLEIIANLIS